MKPLRALALAVVSAALVVAGSASGRAPARSASCSSFEGTVLIYEPRDSDSCGPFLAGMSVYKQETLRAGNPGSVTFHTNHIWQCVEQEGASDTLAPTRAIALRHRGGGTTWCRKKKTGKKITLVTPNARITVSDPTFGLKTVGRTTVVKVAEGRATVSNLRGGKATKVPEGFQVTVRGSQPPSRPAHLVLNPEDRRTVAFFRLSVLLSGPAQVAEWLEGHGERSAVVVADEPNAPRISSELKGFEVVRFSLDQATRDPKGVAAAVQRLHASTVVETGRYDTAIARSLARARAVLPTSVAILFVSAP